MICTWNYAKKLVLIGSVCFMAGYLVMVIFWRGPHIGSLEYPSYELVNPWYNSGKYNSLIASDTQTVLHIPVLDTTNYVFVPSSFNVNTIYVGELFKHSAYQAMLFSIEFHSLLRSNKTNNQYFSCRCGRVSDPCVCCGKLSAPPVGDILTRRYSPQPIILQPLLKDTASTNDNQPDPQSRSIPPDLCVNITYRPKTGKIHLAAAILSSQDTSLPEKENTNNAGNPPKQTSAPTQLVLFDELLSKPLSNPPTTCAENPKIGADISLCVNLTGLSYIYDAGTEHKTAFVGCGRVQIILHRAYVVSDYGEFCFRAHRGAVDDADQKAAAPVTSNQAVGVGLEKKAVAAQVPTPAALPGGSGEVGQVKAPVEVAGKTLEAEKPRLSKGEVEDLGKAKEKAKPIAGSFDHNDAIRGNP